MCIVGVKRSRDIFPRYTSFCGIIAYCTRRYKPTALYFRTSMEVANGMYLWWVEGSVLTEGQTEEVTVPSYFDNDKIEKLNAQRQSQGFCPLRVFVLVLFELDPLSRLYFVWWECNRIGLRVLEICSLQHGLYWWYIRLFASWTSHFTDSSFSRLRQVNHRRISSSRIDSLLAHDRFHAPIQGEAWIHSVLRRS